MRPTPAYNVIAMLSWPVLYGLFRLRARGRENLPVEGGYVLACNHVSSLDPWLRGLPLWPHSFLRFMAKSELYWWPLRLVLDGGGAFKVRRGLADVEAIETAEAFRRHLDDVFAEVDVLLTPGAVGEAPAGLGSPADPSFNSIWTLGWPPCVPLPAGRGPGGLPLGIQLVGPRFRDEALFDAAAWVEAHLAA